MLKPRKRLVKAKLKEDKLLIFTARAQKYFDDYKKQIVYGVGGVVLLIALALLIGWSKSNSEREASFEGLMIRDAYQRGDLDETLTKANILLEDFSGTKAAAYALLLKGRVHEQRAEYTLAEEAFKELISKYPHENYLAFGAQYALGAIYFGRGDYAEAGEQLKTAALKYPDHYSAPVSLVEAGIAFKKASKYDDAQRVLKLVLSDYSKSRSVDAARKVLEEIEFMD